MSKTSSVLLNIQVLGDGINPFNLIPSFISNTQSPLAHNTVTLTNGNTVVSVPSNSMIALIVPISGALVAKTLKGTTTDSGVGLSTNNPTLISLSTTQVSICLNANGSENIDVYFF